MLTPLDEHQLLVFWVQLIVLLVAARGLGYLARRFGQPAVVGELTAGLLLGPSVFGKLAPDLAAWVFPGDEVQSSLLLAVAWLGIVFLLVVTGMEIDLPLVRRLLRSTALVPLGSLLLPLALGTALGFVLPDAFIGEGTDRAVFAGFVGVALAMSALPVVARILMDMGLIRRNVGQVTMVAAMADDIVGWLLLGVLAGVAAGGGFEGTQLAVSAGAVVLFLVGALTVGQRAVDLTLRASLRLTDGIAGAVTVTVLIALAFAALSQWIGVEAVFGAFIAGVVFARSPYRRAEVRHHIELLSTAVLAPIFFATAGILLDLGALADLSLAGWAVAILVVATISKLAGSYVGARAGRIDRATALAVGVGLNARGALGIITATVALTLGVFSDAAYTAIVLMSIVTSMTVPPMLARTLRWVTVHPEEQERLDEELLFAQSVAIGATRALLPTRGGNHSKVAARVLDLMMPARTTATVMSVYDTDPAPSQAAVAEVAELFGARHVERRVVAASDPATRILQELSYGHELLAVGASQDVDHPMRMSGALRTLMLHSPVPIVLVRAGRQIDEGLVFRRILTTATGTRVSQAAEEVAFHIAVQAGAEVDVVHVVSRSDKAFAAAWSGHEEVQHATAQSILGRSLALGRRLGLVASGVTRIGASEYEELLTAADEVGADTVVVGTQVRDVGGRPFLGHGIEYLLEHAPQTLIVIAFAADARSREALDQIMATG